MSERLEFVEWYENAYPRLLASLVLALGDRRLAEDACAEGCARAFSAWKRVSQMRSPSGWVFKVAANYARRSARRANMERAVLRRSPSTGHAPDPAGIDPVVWEAVRKLPLRQRKAIALRYIGDASQAEVADRMGVEPGTAAATLTHARSSLRTELKEYYS